METEIKVNANIRGGLTSNSIGFYNNYWKNGDKVSTITKNRNDELLYNIFNGPIQRTRILEIGVGGEGGMLLSLKNENEVFGIDVSASARRNCKKLGLDILLQNMDTTKIPFESNCFDIVFALEVFEHFANPQFVIEEIKRVLKVEGILVISTPNPLINHWPRIFYPEMFYENAFRDFLIVNNLDILKTVGIGKNSYYSLLQDDLRSAWSYVWKCQKYDLNNQDILFKHGMYFWEKKDEIGIRIKPIEAIDYFRAASKINNDAKARFLLTCSLVYRFINGEKEEFTQGLDYLVKSSESGQYPINMQALYYFALLFLELKKFGIKLLSKDQFHGLLCKLYQFPDSAKFIEKIAEELKGSKILNDRY